MITTTVEILADRYARNVRGAPPVGHLLTRAWPEKPGRGRPALCGVTAQRWRPVAFAEDPGSFEDCADCSVAAGIVTPPPIRIVPTASRRVPAQYRHDPIACTPALPAEANTAAARIGRRVAFRESWAPNSDSYIPAPDSRRPQGPRLVGRFNT